MKKSLKILSLFLLGITITHAQQKESHDVVVNISNFKSNKGQAFVALYDKPESFLSKEVKGAIVKIENNSCRVTFKDVPKGVYAISMFHDENDNSKMDTNFMGIPKETYGCSNNAKGVFGPPKWEDAKFEVSNQSITQHIKL
ncbi:DUF2141 domain-containing protein [Mariniflexile sp.]|uniref:DUF2141 domain-containing protein n=1 Tax=Mariniflexile sp. TaxID=1979402 RepID=UPI003565228D